MVSDSSRRAGYAVQSKQVQGTGVLTKAWDILDLIGGDPGQLTAGDIIKKTSLSKSTAYRILSSLLSRGLIRSEPHGQKLLLGFHFLDLAQNVWAESDLVAISSEELRRLKDMTGETAYLAALSGNSVVSLANSYGAHKNRSSASPGTLKPVYATSQGKAILAFMPERQRDHLLSTLTFTPMTSHTITDSNVLKLSLNVIRQRGFAIDDQEHILGTRCVGAPILDASGIPVAAISVAGPAYRMTLERLEQLSPQLIEATQRLSLKVQEHKARAVGQGHVDLKPLENGETLFLGDKPCWIAKEQCLYWVDKLAPAIYAMQNGEFPRLLAKLSHPIDHVVPARNGGINLVCEGHWYHVRVGGSCNPISRPNASEDTTMCTSPSGELWTCRGQDTGYKIGELSARGVFKPIWTLTRHIQSMTWSRDNKRLFALDGPGGTLFEMQRGRSAVHILSHISRGSGEPCAITVDRDNHLWLALKDGWGLVQLDDIGEIKNIVPLPVPRPTAMAFGGQEEDILYVTTARVGLRREILENAPLSGQLLTIHMNQQNFHIH